LADFTHRTYTPTPVPCRVCLGLEDVQCPTCHGEDIPCRHCNGRRLVICWHCRGDGEEPDPTKRERWAANKKKERAKAANKLKLKEVVLRQANQTVTFEPSELWYKVHDKEIRTYLSGLRDRLNQDVDNY
jgi:hypothetical protein